MQNTNKLWQGANIHIYTSHLQQLLNEEDYIEKLSLKYGTTVSTQMFQHILQSLAIKYGPKVTYSNLKQNFHKGWIRDPELPKLNSIDLRILSSRHLGTTFPADLTCNNLWIATSN